MCDVMWPLWESPGEGSVETGFQSSWVIFLVGHSWDSAGPQSCSERGCAETMMAWGLHTVSLTACFVFTGRMWTVIHLVCQRREALGQSPGDRLCWAHQGGINWVRDTIRGLAIFGVMVESSTDPTSEAENLSWTFLLSGPLVRPASRWCSRGAPSLDSDSGARIWRSHSGAGEEGWGVTSPSRSRNGRCLPSGDGTFMGETNSVVKVWVPILTSLQCRSASPSLPGDPVSYLPHVIHCFRLN